jgi:hypothetical protein
MGILVRPENPLGQRPNIILRHAPTRLRLAYEKYLIARPHGVPVSPLDVFLRVSFAGFAAILATVSVQSYARHRERRFLLLTSAFAIFLVEGVWLVVELAMRTASNIGTEWLAANLGVLVSLYLALLR